ncbi:hypothetical protein PIB30_000640 [Stylosanthes scabra]|uniref:Uncharacterized protein n=1 Tax=Stylosanthes scabra TaxID=79078 RepID=A0ABU6Y4A8_9FABA|nr:hypothetical protein [Stylosanthes scabra]
MADNPDGRLEAIAAEAAQKPRELSSLYQWVSPDVLGAPSILNQAYIDELKGTRVIFGGGDLERRYKMEAAHRGERVGFMNLDHPTKPHWLWVNEVMFTEFGIRVPFTNFQQRLLNRACIASSQLHPNACASIRCFELVTEWLQLPQEPEVFMCLFTFYSANTHGKTKKGYMSVRPTKYRKVFGLFEDSFHEFKGRYFKILPVGTHRPFWLSLEGDGRFPSYWTDRAGFDVAPVTYKGLRVEQKDTVDVLTVLFAKNNLAPKALLGRPEEARRDIGMGENGGNDITLNCLRHLVRPPASRVLPSRPHRWLVMLGRDHHRRLGLAFLRLVLSKRSMPVETSAAKRQRTKTSAREFSPLDRSFDASKFIAKNLLGPKAQEALRDYDPVESFRWVQ